MASRAKNIDDVSLLDLTGAQFRSLLAEELQKLPTPTILAPTPASAGPAGTVATSGDTKPILLHDRHRAALEALFGGPIIDTADEIVHYARRLSAFSLTGPPNAPYESIEIVLPLDTLERLDSRRPLDTSMRDLVIPAILDFIERFINGDA